MINQSLCAACIAAVLSCSGGAAAWAQTTTANANALTSAEVVKLDKEGGRITLKHGEIKNLDMPPMTMVFRVKDRQSVQDLVVGDRVRFAAERIDGNYTVVALSKLP